MLTIKSKVQADADKFYFELNATSNSDLPANGKIKEQNIVNGSIALITGADDAGVFYVFDEENTTWNKVGDE